MNLASAASLSVFFSVKPEKRNPLQRHKYQIWFARCLEVFSWAIFPPDEASPKECSPCLGEGRWWWGENAAGHSIDAASRVAFTNRTSWICTNRSRFVWIVKRFVLNFFQLSLCRNFPIISTRKNNIDFSFRGWWRRNFSSVEKLKSTKERRRGFDSLFIVRSCDRK